MEIAGASRLLVPEGETCLGQRLRTRPTVDHHQASAAEIAPTTIARTTIDRTMIARATIVRTTAVVPTAGRRPLLPWIAATRGRRLPTAVADTAVRRLRLRMTEARWAAPCRPMVAVAADGQCQLTAVEALAEAALLRTVEAEVMRPPTEAAVADTLPAVAEVTPRLPAVEVATAEAATTAVVAITVTKT